MSRTEIYPSAHATDSTSTHRVTDERPNLKLRGFESDRPLIDAIERALRATGRSALRGIAIEVCRDYVVLRGRVPSYYEKQLAQAAARQTADNRTVVNEIEVVCCR